LFLFAVILLVGMAFPAEVKAANPPADIVFMIDESGSMGDDINQVRNNVNNIASQLGASLDPRYALVEFGGQNSGPGNPGLTTNLTDAAGLSAALSTLYASGGFEPGVEATIFAHDNVGFRPGSGVCYVLITDEDSDGGDLATAVSLLQGQNATWFGIVNPGYGNTATTYGPNAGSLSEATGGSVFSIYDFRSDAQPVLDALLTQCIGSIIEGVVLTPPVAENPVGTDHTVTATVRDSLANPLSGIEVTFEVTSGPNAGETGTAITDANGEATFTYTGNGGAGTDIIEASFTDSQTGDLRTDTAEKTWVMPDETAPRCELTAINYGPPVSIEVEVEDAESGVERVQVTDLVNATAEIPMGSGQYYSKGQTAPFAPPTTAVTTIEAVKIDQSTSSRLVLAVSDAAGNQTVCDPVITLQVREKGKPVSSTFEDVPEQESVVIVSNGAPGLKNLDVVVNGTKYKVAGLGDNEETSIDVSAAMVPGDDNTVVLTAKGKPGSSAVVTIRD
jgi:hypothetical protein